jgi:hypothetical protein
MMRIQFLRSGSPLGGPPKGKRSLIINVRQLSEEARRERAVKLEGLVFSLFFPALAHGV